MTFLCSLITTSFSGVTHGRVIRVFHDLIKLSTIPQAESKTNAFSNLRGIVNALCVLEDNGSKNYHPLSAPLPSTDPVNFYRQDSHRSLPKFPARCVILLGRHTFFFPPGLPLTVVRYYSIQVFSWVLVYLILVDAI